MEKDKMLSLSHLKFIISGLLSKKPNWSQNDECADDYIKNRTHYEYLTDEIEQIIIFEDDIFPTSMAGIYYFPQILNFEENKKYCIYMNGNLCYSGELSADTDTQTSFPFDSDSYCYINAKMIHLAKNQNTHLKIVEEVNVQKTVVKLLDDKYISSRIARKFELQDYAKQSELSGYATITRYASTSRVGLVKVRDSYGTKMVDSQYIATNCATTSDISSKSNQYKPIVPYNLDEAVRYGLGASKLTWTEEQKAKARSVIGAVGKDDITADGSIGVGSKERILLFKDAEFTKESHYKDFSTLGVTELMESLELTNGGYVTILDKYRMIFFINNQQRAVIECVPPMKLDSGTSFYAPFLVWNSADSKYELGAIEHQSAYGGTINLTNLQNNYTGQKYLVTCYLEEL